ncbi:glutathione S-transferase Yb-3 [Lingula anatina]|uniref:glutathione transferase n=1 Tax=Lingula anatina TaxID=7574 RepID=A0A1S3K4W3_LINAN|nr:glutathione S-transferase Yb-3 [Lingula anatina]|eukprot:XP_013417454.1 glutathione S-transferase Yb-3 [Lingula anatina]
MSGADGVTTMAPSTLGYWRIRGLAQPIRLLLQYVGEDYEEKLYDFGPEPSYDREIWYLHKHSLGLAFPNLPYYLDGDVKLTQSSAILRYIGRKYGLCGKTEQEKTRVDLIQAQATDFKMGYARLVYAESKEEFEDLKIGYLAVLPTKLEEFSEFLGDLPWFAGNEISIADFLMYEYLEEHLILQSECLDKYKNLAEFVKRFESLDRIQEYQKSKDFINWPINTPVAQHGTIADPEPPLPEPVTVTTTEDEGSVAQGEESKDRGPSTLQQATE